MGMVEDTLSDLRKSVDGALASLKQDLGKLRTGRANAAILDGVRVDYYGTLTPLNQCANVMVADARMLVVKPWERNLIPEIEKAISRSDIGITPQSDGEQIRLPVPALNQERRAQLAKQAKARGEDARISMRNARRDAKEMLEELEKGKEISQDELKKGLEKMQVEVDRGSKLVDDVLAIKEKEIMEV